MSTKRIGIATAPKNPKERLANAVIEYAPKKTLTALRGRWPDLKTTIFREPDRLGVIETSHKAVSYKTSNS